MSIVLGLNQVFHAGSYALNMRHKWFQLPCDKYHRWHHCVNNFELQAPNNIHMQGPRYPFAISPMAIIISFWLNKNAYDEFSGEDTNHQPKLPLHGMKTQQSHETDCCQNDVYA